MYDITSLTASTDSDPLDGPDSDSSDAVIADSVSATTVIPSDKMYSKLKMPLEQQPISVYSWLPHHNPARLGQSRSEHTGTNINTPN